MNIEAYYESGQKCVGVRCIRPDFYMRRSHTQLEVAALSPRGRVWISRQGPGKDDTDQSVLHPDVALANVLLREAIREGPIIQYVGPNEIEFF